MVAYCMHGTCADALNTKHQACTTYSAAQGDLWNNDNLLAGNICASCCLAQERQNRLVFPRGRFVVFTISKQCQLLLSFQLYHIVHVDLWIGKPWKKLKSNHKNLTCTLPAIFTSSSWVRLGSVWAALSLHLVAWPYSEKQSVKRIQEMRMKSKALAGNTPDIW